MPSGKRKPTRNAATAAGDAVRQMIVDATKEAVTEKLNTKIAGLADKAAKHIDGHADSFRVAHSPDLLEVWTRSAAGKRQPKLSRTNIARTAIAIADDEGFDAVSMRRIASKLAVGTMSLYHYVRTKDELLMVMFDEFLAEVVLPEGEELPLDWREAITIIARRSRDATRRHPWILDVSDDPNFGPNAIRHFDQSWGALRGMDASLEFKMDIVMSVDEYVFGYCLHERNNFTEGGDPMDMIDYVARLIAANEYPAVASIVSEIGLDSFWRSVHAQARDKRRFDRNLARLLDGFEVALERMNTKPRRR